MKRRRAFLLAMLVAGVSYTQAQTIQLHFPFFAGAPFTWILFQGERTDTLTKGVIPPDGRVDLVMPEQYNEYVGMTRWMLTSTQGGGLDLIVNKASYQVICLEPTPSKENIHFVGSSENPFLNEQYEIQQDLLMKAEAIRVGLESYRAGEPFYGVLIAEMERLKSDFASHQQSIAQHPSYAAQFRRIVDFTRGVADQLYDTEHERAIALDRFITHGMDWNALYTSNHWSGVIQNWIEMHVYAIQNDDELLAGTRTILSRITNPELYTDVAVQLVRGFSKFAKDDLLAELSPEIRKSGKLLHMNGALMVFAGLYKGDTATVPIGITHAKNIYKNGALVFFYESDCGNCLQAKTHFISEYHRLRKHNVRIISISSDAEKNQNEKTLLELPWPDKISDNLECNGVNFKTWGVLGTPTIFLIDKKGIILGRYAALTVSDALGFLGIHEP